MAPFKVIVADNYHYMDESENYELGSFETFEAAIDACKKIVDEFLESACSQGVSGDELLKGYLMFGEDPYILSSEIKGVPFSARDYARLRCVELGMKGGPQGDG
jgi:hypothetical protein